VVGVVGVVRAGNVVGVVRAGDVDRVAGTVVGGEVEVVAFPRDVVVVEPSDEVGVIANDGSVGATAR